MFFTSFSSHSHTLVLPLWDGLHPLGAQLLLQQVTARDLESIAIPFRPLGATGSSPSGVVVAGWRSPQFLELLLMQGS